MQRGRGCVLDDEKKRTNGHDKTMLHQPQQRHSKQTHQHELVLCHDVTLVDTHSTRGARKGMLWVAQHQKNNARHTDQHRPHEVTPLRSTLIVMRI